MGPVDICCVNTAVKTDINTAIQCPVTRTCSHEAMLLKPETCFGKSVKMQFNNLEQKYNCEQWSSPVQSSPWSLYALL